MSDITSTTITPCMQLQLGLTDEDIMQLVLNEINNDIAGTRIDETPSEDDIAWNDYVDRVEAAGRLIEEMKAKEASEDSYE